MSKAISKTASEQGKYTVL